MSRCYPGDLQAMRKSSGDYQPVSATETQDMERSVFPTSHGKEGKDSGNPAILGKRKKIQTEVVTSHTTSLNNKRPRETIQPSSSPPRGVGTTVTSHTGGSSHVDNTRERPKKTPFCSLYSSGLPYFVPSDQCREGKKACSERSDLSEARDVSSAYGGSGLGNQSTVTTSSIVEQEESTLLQSSGQTLKLLRKTDTVNVFSIGSTGKRTGNHNDDHYWEKQTVAHRQRERRKSRLRDHHSDGEVVSPFSNFFTSVAARDVDEDSVSGSKFQVEVSYGDRSGETETTCVLNSGCSSVVLGRRESATRRATDDSCSIQQREDCSELVHSSCSRELQCSSIEADVSSISDSMLSGMVNAYRLYRPIEPSHMKGSVNSFSAKNFVVDERADSGHFVSDELQRKGKRSGATPQSSHGLSQAQSRSVSEEEPQNFSGPTDVKFSGKGSHPHVDGSLEQTTAPTFVLSSGRMSQEEASRHKGRPPTVDDEFDEYFAQLML